MSMENELIRKLVARIRELEEENALVKEELDAYKYVQSKNEHRMSDEDEERLQMFEGLFVFLKDVLNNPDMYVKESISIDDVDDQMLLDDSEFYKINDPELENIDDND